MKTKICNLCKEEKNIKEFSKNFHSIAKKYYHRQPCKICRANNIKIDRKMNIDKYREKDIKRYKTEKRQLWIKENKDKALISNKKHKENNKDKIKEQERKYYLKNRDAKMLRKKEYSKENPEKVKLWQKNSYIRNRATYIFNSIKRQNFKNKCMPKYANLEKIKLIYIKAKELSLLTGFNYDVDHVIPLQGKNVCGFHVWENLQIMESSLNKMKGNKFIVEIG